MDRTHLLARHQTGFHSFHTIDREGCGCLRYRCAAL